MDYRVLSTAERRGTPGEGFLYQESAVGRVKMDEPGLVFRVITEAGSHVNIVATLLLKCSKLSTSIGGLLHHKD